MNIFLETDYNIFNGWKEGIMKRETGNGNGVKQVGCLSISVLGNLVNISITVDLSFSNVSIDRQYRK